MRQNKINPYDKRLTRRLVNRGALEQSEVDKHLKNLPDDEANAEWVRVDQDENEVGNPSDSGSEFPE